MQTMSAHGEGAGFVHSALFYRDQPEYLHGVVPFILDGLRKGEPVLVAVPTDNLALLRDALGDVTAELTMADLCVVGRNPARILGIESAFAAGHAGPVRVVGEPIWPGRTADEYPGCVQHEALVNLAFEGTGASVLCPYDACQLAGDVLADARMTHPLVAQSGSRGSSADYAPDDALARYNQPLPHSPEAVAYVTNTHADLRALRSFAARHAQWLGLSPDGLADLQIIATELATNSLDHTGGACRLALWRHDAHVVCEASDSGRLGDPLAGRRPPAGDAVTGRGLFLVNAMADLVRTHATPTGTTIQVYLRPDPALEVTA